MAAKTVVPKLFFLIGMPAVGKTYWGKKVAAQHSLSFIDIDLFITAQEKASIPALFAMYGENGFREREEKYLRKIIKDAKKDTIVACGGGTPCFRDNIEIMKKAGQVIYLQAEVPLLLGNLKLSDEIRPLLNNRGELAVYLQDMLHRRKQFYEQAHHILLTKDISLANFAKIIAYV